MKNRQIAGLTISMLLQVFSINTKADDNITLDTTIIKGNSELPKIIYVVPWEDTKKSRQEEQKLTLHSLFGDLFDPLSPPSPAAINNQQKKET